MNCFPIAVIARLDRAIQRKELDPPVKPEDDSIVFDFYALRQERRVLDKNSEIASFHSQRQDLLLDIDIEG